MIGKSRIENRLTFSRKYTANGTRKREIWRRQYANSSRGDSSILPLSFVTTSVWRLFINFHACPRRRGAWPRFEWWQLSASPRTSRIINSLSPEVHWIPNDGSLLYPFPCWHVLFDSQLPCSFSTESSRCCCRSSTCPHSLISGRKKKRRRRNKKKR